MDDARSRIVDVSRRLVASGLCTGTAGNVSVRVDGGILITPSGLAPDAMGPADVCLVGEDGHLLAGGRTPSSEVAMHLAAYRATGAAAVVHTHPPYGTALSTTHTELPPLHYLVARLGGPVRVAPYALFGTPELAEHAASALAGRAAALLACHGAITVGATVEEAGERAVLLEWLCQVTWLALQAGTPQVLSDDELAAATAQFDRLRYGES